MAKTSIPPQVEIAALKKKIVQQNNLMQPGPGTPWEDRGSLGVLKAFVLTAFRSIFNPGLLWDELSRPETTRDATAFAMGCGLLTGLSWVVHSLAWDLFYSGRGPHDGVPPLLIRDDPLYQINWNVWAMGVAIQIAIGVFGTILMLRLANAVYQKLIPHKMAFRIPQSLTYNLLAYSLGGPALLSLLPMYGWVLALAWLFFLMIYAGIRRLSLGAGGGIIAGILTMLVVMSVGFGAYFAGDFLWAQVTGTSVTYFKPLAPGERPL